MCGEGGGGRHKAEGAPLSGEGGASAPNAPPMGTPLQKRVTDESTGDWSIGKSTDSHLVACC